MVCYGQDRVIRLGILLVTCLRSQQSLIDPFCCLVILSKKVIKWRTISAAREITTFLVRLSISEMLFREPVPDCPGSSTQRTLFHHQVWRTPSSPRLHRRKSQKERTCPTVCPDRSGLHIRAALHRASHRHTRTAFERAA